MVRRQHGLLLLPVAIALTIMAALAYGMTRQGAMSAGAVDTQYDLEVTRYLAEAGLRLAKWQNEKIGCDSDQRFTNVRLPGVDGLVSVDRIVSDHEKFTPTVTARSARGTNATLSRDKMMFFDRSRLYSMKMPDSAIKDTWISSVDPTASYGSSPTLEATDGKAHILVSVSMGSIPNNARVMKARLSMVLVSSNSVQTTRKLEVYPVTRSWSDGSATWNSPWNTSPGGSAEPRMLASADVPGASGTLEWEIAPVMRRWSSGALGNNGLLLKPLGLNGANFASINAAANRPQVNIDYSKRCD